MEDGGLVVSEYEAGGAGARRFPARNRIIAGLCEAVGRRGPRAGGALITADFALEEGREVLRAGRDHGALSVGSNGLLRLGERRTGSGDVLDALGIERLAVWTIRTSPRRPGECWVGSRRAGGGRRTGRQPRSRRAAVSVALTELELAGLGRRCLQSGAMTLSTIAA